MRAEMSRTHFLIPGIRRDAHSYGDIQMGMFSGNFLDTAVQVHAPLLTLELSKGDIKWFQN